MASYTYIKAPLRQLKPKNAAFSKGKKRFLKLLPNILIVIGATAVTTVMYPLVSYQITNYRWDVKKIISPIPTEQWEAIKTMAREQAIRKPAPVSPVVANEEPVSTPQVVANLDYTQALNWFPAIKKDPAAKQPETSKVIEYTLSIPKLKIKDMKVEYGDNDLNKHLVQYQGTAMPGELGNSVIFGHSILPVFYNPKSYMSVFSLLPTLEEDDEIFITYDGIKYRYVVESYKEVQPTEVSVLKQQYDDRKLSLITCVPPGTYLRRGVIQARLESE